MAFLVVVALYASMLAWTRVEPAYASRARPTQLPVDQLPDPGPPLQGHAHPPPRPERSAPPPGTIRTRVKGTNTGTGSLVLVLLDRESHVRLGKHEMAGALPETVVFAGVRPGRYSARLTRRADCARHSYVAAADLELAPGGVAAVELEGATRSASLQLLDGSAPASGVPLWIRRTDYPDWRYRQPDSTTTPGALVLTDADGRATFADLGAGRYTIETEGFEPVESDRARLTFALGELDERRPIRGRVR